MSQFIKNIIFNLWNRNPRAIKRPENIFTNPKKILFLRQDRIGDLIISTPVFKAIKEKFPNAQLDILLSKYNWQAFNLCSTHLDGYYIFKKGFFGFFKTISEIRRNKYDVVIDLTDNPSTTSTLLTGFSKASNRLGFLKENSGVYDFTVIPHSRSEVHIARRLLMLLLPFGIDLNNISHKPVIKIDNAKLNSAKDIYKTEKDAIGIVISGSNDSKFWGFDNINQLISLIVKRTDSQVLVYQTPQYPNVEDNFIGSPRIKYIKTGKTIEDFAALVTLSSIIVTPDTAAIHLGSALGIKQVTLFKVIDKEKYGMPWYPIEVPYKVFEDGASIRNIQPEKVFEAVLELT